MFYSKVFILFYLSIVLKTVYSLNYSYFSIENVYQFEDFELKTDENLYKKWIPPKMSKVFRKINFNRLKFSFSPGPISVNASFFLYSYGAIDDLKSEFTISLLLRFRWFDERLSIDTNTEEIYSLEGGKYHLKRIWTPSLHIPTHPFPDFLQTDDKRPVLTRVFTNGEVLVSKRIVLTGFCGMDYTLYPLDKQFCDMEIESIDMSDYELRLDWSDNEPFTITDEFNWSGFELTGYTLARAKSRYKLTGSFSKLVATFSLEREFSHFILDIYIPSILFVISSWTSFWLEIPAAPARVTLGITTMLTLVTSAKTARDKLPRVSYIHALDIWLMMCTFFIFASLVEYATVNYIYNKQKRHKIKQKNNLNQNNLDSNGFRRTKSTNSFQNYKQNNSYFENNLRSTASSPILRRVVSSQSIYNRDVENGLPDNSRRSSLNESIQANCIQMFVKRPEDIANDIDRRCRFIFPISFLSTNIIYWTTLAFLSSKVE